MRGNMIEGGEAFQLFPDTYSRVIGLRDVRAAAGGESDGVREQGIVVVVVVVAVGTVTAY